QDGRDVGQTVTDEGGRFSLPGLGAGIARVTALYGGVTASTDVQMTPPQTTEAALTLGASVSSPPPLEVTVTGQTATPRRLRESAEAVTVVELQRAAQQTRDLGEVLASVEGVSVRRMGGLGSATSFSLNGLSDKQIRFFFDGVPLDVLGYGGAIANI